jgi:long-chain fatty acid transport protein
MRLRPTISNLAMRIILGTLVWIPVPLWAAMPEVSGLGIRDQSLAGMGVALQQDASASYYNPAGLTGIKFNNDFGFNLELGLSTFDVMATAQSSTRGSYTPGDLERANHIYIGMSFDLTHSLGDFLGGRRLTMGSSMLFPTDSLYWWRLQFPEEERHPFYYDDIHRMVAFVGAGLEINSWLSVGLSANIQLELETNTEGPVYLSEEELQQILSGLGGNASNTYVDIQRSELAENQKTKLAVAPVIGVQFKPLPELNLGLTYRQELYMDDYGDNNLSILIMQDTVSPLSITFDYAHHFAHYYSPNQWAAGLSYTLPDGLMLSAEATWMGWSDYLDWLHEEPVPHFKDVIDFKIGAQKQAIQGNSLWGDITLRAGYGFWKSPVPEQTGATNFIDNDKHILGLGIECLRPNLGTWWNKPVSLQAMLQYHYLVDRTNTKAATGEEITYGGYAYAGGVSLEFQF